MTYQESLLLIGDKWTSIDDNKKIEVLQAIENHMAFESNRLPVPVEGKFMHTGTDGIVLGMYDPNKGCMYINTSQFDSEAMYGKDSSTIVKTCLHEGRHAYQHQVVNGIVQHSNSDEVELWRENLKGDNYISFEENPRGYYEQPVEVDAREFAANRYNELQTEQLQAEINHPNDYSCAKNTFEFQMNNPDSNERKAAADYQSTSDNSQHINSSECQTEGLHP